MRNRYLYIFLIFTLITGLLLGQVVFAHAQGITPTPTVAPAATPLVTAQPVNLAVDSNKVTFDLLGMNEIHLAGPFDAIYFAFGLPADWTLSAGAQLNLMMNITVSTGINTVTDSTGTVQNLTAPSTGVVGGNLTIVLNNTTLAIVPLEQVGDIERSVQIPLDAFTTDRTDGRMILGLILDSGFSCNSYSRMDLIIRTTSNFMLPHELTKPSTDLTIFPRPLYQNSFVKDTALLVVPDQPTPAEMQAALTVATGLGVLTGNNVGLDLVTQSELSTTQRESSNLIFIGKAASLSLLEPLQLPLPINGGQYQIGGDNPDDGVVQMIDSPWSDAYVVFVVSGNTDQGVIKAAQATSTGVLRPNNSANLSIVQNVQDTVVATSQPVDRTLADLGYESKLFENRGISTVSYNFYIPPGWNVAPDANFDLVFGNSALLDYTRSGIVVLLNGQPIGSVRLSDATASLSNNQVQITIPASAITPGTNRLDVRVNLIPRDDCTPPNMRGLWVNIWPESKLHLPLDVEPIDPISSLDLAGYPAPFTYYPTLDNTAFVLPSNNVEVWREALQIAGIMGSMANGPVSVPTVFFGDNVSEADRANFNMLIIGQPSQMPIVQDLNGVLPVPFSEGSDNPTAGNFQVLYRISPDSPLGYIEMMPSPWNPDKMILTVLGNTPQGVTWATSSLINPTLRARLAGNFAVINNQQILTTDTRMNSTIDFGTSQPPVAEVVPPTVSTTPAPVQRPAWILPTLAVLIVLMILILAIVGIRSWSRNRFHRK